MKRNIVIWPDSILRKKCLPVPETGFDSDLRKLLDDMEETMLAAGGAGLAAPQVGFSVRAIVVLVEDQKNKQRVPLALINPTIVAKRNRQRKREGCLSLPGFFDQVERFEWVSVVAQDTEGKPIAIEGDGVLAHSLQHEIEHLDGIVFVDHLSILKRNIAKRHFEKAKKQGMRYVFEQPAPRDFAAPSE